MVNYWEANINCSGIRKEEMIYSGYHRNDQDKYMNGWRGRNANA